MVRGLLAEATGDENRPWRRMILKTLAEREVLEFVDSAEGKRLALTPPLTTDHLIRTKSLPLWVDAPDYDDAEKLRGQVAQALKDYVAAYEGYFERHAAGLARRRGETRSLSAGGTDAGPGSAVRGQDGAGQPHCAGHHGAHAGGKAADRGDGRVRGARGRAPVPDGIPHAAGGQAERQRGAGAGAAGGADYGGGGSDRVGDSGEAAGGGLPGGVDGPGGRESGAADGRSENEIRRPGDRRAAGRDGGGIGAGSVWSGDPRVGRRGPGGGERGAGARGEAGGAGDGSVPASWSG